MDDCKPCPKGVPMWMATFSDMAILLMAFFALLISFNNTEVGGAQMISGKLDEQFGVQNKIPVVVPPKGDNVLAKTFSPARVAPTLVTVVRESTTYIRPPKDITLTRLNRQKVYKRNADVELLEVALAKEIATGKVLVIPGEFKTIVEIPSQDVTGDFKQSDFYKKGFTVREEDVKLYAKVAKLQAKIEQEVQIKYVNDQKNTLADQFDAIRQALIKEINIGQAEVIMEDERIIIRLAEQGSFASGRAEIKPSFRRLLTKLGVSLRDVTGEITVEGHTDNIPMAYNTQFRNNWDLSAARSSAVVEYLLGVVPQVRGKIMASGMADIKPLMTNDTITGRARNRRIEVIVTAP
jgi:chemotaxis protein MotB